MTLEASDRLIDIIWISWRCTCGCISRLAFKLSASLLDIMEKNLKKSAKTSEKNYRPPQVWFILGSNFQTPVGTTFICTNKSKYKHHGATQLSYHSGRRCVLSSRDEWTTAKDLVKMLGQTGSKVSISTVKRVLYRQPERPLSKEEPLLQNFH